MSRMKRLERCTARSDELEFDESEFAIHLEAHQTDSELSKQIARYSEEASER